MNAGHKISVSENERKCLAVLADGFDEFDWRAYYLRHVVSETGLTLGAVRRAVRSLARKELAKYERGLLNEDGQVAGSGYRATREGAALINPCDVCGDVASYDYDDKRECGEHYGQSAKTGAMQMAMSDVAK